MKKTVSVLIEPEIWDYMEKNFTNKSALIGALIRKYYSENKINIPKKDKDLEILDKK